MDQALTLEDFEADPVGKYVLGSTWLHFRRSPQVAGVMMWGHLTEKEVARAAKLTPTASVRGGKSMVLADVRRVDQVEPRAFAVGAEYVKRHRKAIEASTARLAIVYTPGLAGAVAAGFFRIIRPPCQTEIFTDPFEASRWLAVERAADLFAELGALHATATGTEPLLRDLRGALETRLRGNATLGDLARTLHLSQRTLQRRLAERGTSFQQELTLARVRQAQNLLRRGDATLTQIAASVGCASLFHFTSVFKKVTGETPALWRARGRTANRA